MPEVLDALFVALIGVTVFLTALAIGTETSVAAIKEALRRRSLAVLLVGNLLVVPLVGFLVVAIFPLSSSSATGVLLCAICAAGPIGLKATQIARGDLAWALSSTVLLLVLNVVFLPLWGALLLDRSLSLRPGDLFRVMVVAVLVPVVVGMLVRRRGVGPAGRWAHWATGVSNVTLALAVVTGVVANASDLATALYSWVPLAATTVVVAAGFLAWALPAAPFRRRTSTLVTINRATSVALLVVGRSFSGDGEVFTAVIVFGLVQTVTALGLSLVWGRRVRLSMPAPTG